MPGSSFIRYKTSRSYFVRLLNLLEEISMSSNLSSKQLRFVSMLPSFFFLGLKEDLSLNLSAASGRASFLKCHVSRSFLPYSSDSIFNFARSVLLAVGTNFKPLDNNETSEAERFPLERFIASLLTNLPFNLSPIYEAMLFRFKTLPTFSQL